MDGTNRGMAGPPTPPGTRNGSKESLPASEGTVLAEPELRPEEECEAACVLSAVLMGRVLLKLRATPVTGAQLPGTFLLFDSSVC